MPYKLVYKIGGLMQGTKDEIKVKTDAITMALSLIDVYAPRVAWENVEPVQPQVWKIENPNGDYIYIEEQPA